jgi:hypothetical protein
MHWRVGKGDKQSTEFLLGKREFEGFRHFVFQYQHFQTSPALLIFFSAFASVWTGPEAKEFKKLAQDQKIFGVKDKSRT